MNPSDLSSAELARLHDEALQRAHELRRQAIVDAWDALFRFVRRLTRARVAPRASPRLR